MQTTPRTVTRSYEHFNVASLKMKNGGGGIFEFPLYKSTYIFPLYKSRTESSNSNSYRLGGEYLHLFKTIPKRRFFTRPNVSVHSYPGAVPLPEE